MTSKMKMQTISKIYDCVAKSGLTSHKFMFDGFNMIKEVRNVINRYFMKNDMCISCLIIDDLGVTCDGMRHEWKCVLENPITGDQIGEGIIFACACGYITEVWSSYDICISFWAV